MKRIFVAIFLLICNWAGAQLDEAIPKKPNPPKLVNDFADMLTNEQEHALENKLVAYNDSTGSQIAIVTVETLRGYEDEEFALAIGRTWGVGGREFSNGIVILIAKEERASRIEVGRGLEGAIPDITAKTIIDHAIIPNFRQGNYYRGLDQATDDIFKAAAGEYKATPSPKKGKGKGIGFGAIIFILIMIFLIAGRGGRGGGGMISRRGYRDVATGWLIGTLLSGGRGGGGGWSGGGGGWSGGGGSGGFGGFGGGGFGGGGASGNW